MTLARRALTTHTQGHSENGRRRDIANDKTLKETKNPSRVVLGEGYEIAYWSQKFAVSPEKLAEAVKAAGNFSTAVEEYLKSSGSLPHDTKS